MPDGGKWRGRAGELRNQPELLLLAAGTLALVLLHAWWLARFRQGYPLDIDESGYMGASLGSLNGLRTGGLHGFWQSVQHQGQNAPLLPGVTAVSNLLIGGDRLIPSMMVQLPFFGVLVVASYGIGRRLAGARAGLLAALAVGTVPWITDFARTYHLVIPSTAMFTAATWALLESEGLRRRRWAIAFGVCAGLTLLARTMMLAFVPALVLAAACVALLARSQRRERLLNLVIALGALAATASLWYVTSLGAAIRYLRGFGYGAQSQGTGVSQSPLSADYWTHELGVAVNLALYVPLALVLGATFIAAAAGRLRGGARPRPPSLDRLRTFATSDAFVLLVVVLEGYLALTSSRNEGTGFVVPLLPPLIALAVLALWRLPWRSVRVVLVAALVGVSLFNIVMKADVADPPSERRVLDLPGLGAFHVTNGEGYLHQHLRNTGAVTLGPPTQPLPPDYKQWLGLYAQTARFVTRAALEQGPDTPPLANLAGNEPLLNTPALSLAARRANAGGFLVAGVSTGGRDEVRAYQEYLASALPRYLLTITGRPRPLQTPITGSRVEAAARSLGFRQIGALAAPDHRQLHVLACCEPGALRRGLRRLGIDRGL